jgi:hypothetical protein
MMYYTATTSAPFYRSLVPIVSGPVTETANPDGSVTLTIADTSGAYYDAGFYYMIGTLGTLTTGNGMTVTGTGFDINLWVNPQDWTWNGNTYTGLGTDGSYGLGSTTGTTTVNGASTFFLVANMCGLSSGTTQSISAIESACGASTPIEIWIGIAASSIGTFTATVSSVSVGSGSAFTTDGSGNIPSSTYLYVPAGTTAGSFYVITYAGSTVEAASPFTVTPTVTTTTSTVTATATETSTATATTVETSTVTSIGITTVTTEVPVTTTYVTTVTGPGTTETSTVTSTGTTTETTEVPVTTTYVTTVTAPGTTETSTVTSTGTEMVTTVVPTTTTYETTVTGPGTTTTASSPLQITCTPNPVTVGKMVTCKVFVIGAPAVHGTVDLSFNGSPVTCTLKRGTYHSACILKYVPSSATPVVITATYSSYSALLTLTVNRATSRTTLACSHTSVKVTKTVMCTVVVTGYNPSRSVTLTPSPTGDVTVVQNSCTSASKTLRCTFTLTGVNAGKISIEATYSGDFNNFGSLSSVRHLTVKP